MAVASTAQAMPQRREWLTDPPRCPVGPERSYPRPGAAVSGNARVLDVHRARATLGGPIGLLERALELVRQRRRQLDPLVMTVDEDGAAERVHLDLAVPAFVEVPVHFLNQLGSSILVEIIRELVQHLLAGEALHRARSCIRADHVIWDVRSDASANPSFNAVHPPVVRSTPPARTLYSMQPTAGRC